jgi:hypothetical protein
VFNADKETIVQIAKVYLKTGSLKVTGGHFGIHSITVKKNLFKLEEFEKELFLRVKQRIEDNNIFLHPRPKPAKKPKPKIFEGLGDKVTKRQLIDWYCKTSKIQDLSVKDLIKLAKENGVMVIDG